MDFSVVAAAREDGGPVDEPVRVGVAATAGDPAGERTLTALADLV